MNQRGLILWLGLFAGTILLYAAYKNQSPLKVVRTGIGNNTKPKNTDTNSGSAGSGGGGGGGVWKPSMTLASGFSEGNNGSNIVSQSDGYYSTDSYGNPIDKLPPGYQLSPATWVVK